MKKLALITTMVITGCASQHYPETIDEYIPHVTSKKEWDGSKGEFPPGRIINYKVHGLKYENHTQHHYHLNETKQR
jgi:hypothetical protein|tara:strand:- start:1455 stop:1682 length:228 start_codon:yes stop_codon:yes gene_type:complete